MSAGLESTFQAIVDRHERSVLRVCRSILRDDHLGADAAQETFLRLWRHLAEGRAPRRFGAWLRRVAVNTSIDLARRRVIASSLPVPDPAYEPIAGPSSGPEGGLLSREIRERYESALLSLPAGQRTVFLLRHSGGLTLAQVAETLDVAIPTVKTQFARACLKLQAALSNFDPRAST